MKIRPHHILCLNNFIGKGYSNNFTKNMSDIKNSLTTLNKDIYISSCCDDVCQNCPHRNGRYCTTNKKVEMLDKKTLEILGLKDNSSYSWDYLSFLFKQKVLQCNQLEYICSGCCWLELCTEITKDYALA